MKKYLILICASAAILLLILGIILWRSAHKDKALCTVTYRATVGYSLSMTADGGKITVTYTDDGRDPIVKDVDGSCYDNLVSILETYDFPSWKKASDPKAATADADTLEIGFANGKTYFFSRSQELPEMARETFSAIKSCLMEYVGLVK